MIALTLAFLEYMSEAEPIIVGEGMQLRLIRRRDMCDMCSDIYLEWYEMKALDGPWAGQIITVRRARRSSVRRRSAAASKSSGPSNRCFEVPRGQR